MPKSERFIFGPFLLSVEPRELTRRGTPVRLGSRALDLLVALVRRRGALATTNDLIEEVWPDTVVEENNLKVQVSALRQMFAREDEGGRYLATVAGRGYRFAAPVVVETGDEPAEPEPRSFALPRKPSIAVLPFANIGNDPEQEYFADGVVEEIITALARFPSLFVIARNSSFAYKRRAVDIKQVGRELGIRYVLEGSVRRAGDRIRITGQLIQADTGAHVWAERYDGDIFDIFALQDKMTTSIVGALVPSLQRAEIARARGKHTGSLDAYDLYLRALPAVYSYKREGSDQALDLLKRALSIDPDFVSAILLAEVCWVLRYTHGWSPLEQALAESTRLARLAVQLEPDNADALAVLARRTPSIDQDYDEAKALAERAVATNPNSALAWRQGGWACVFSGFPEQALSYFDQALRLSPRDPTAVDLYAGMANALMQLERDPEAVAAARKAVRHNPDNAPAWRALTCALALCERLDDARTALHHLENLDPNFSIQTLRTRFGWSEKAGRRIFDGLRKVGVSEGFAPESP